MGSKSLFALIPVWSCALATGVICGALPKRADTSLFNPETNGLPHKQDVIEFTKNLPKEGLETIFGRTFALVVYALAQMENGEQVKALFHEADGIPGIYNLHYYEPIEHKPSSTQVGFEGLLNMDGGNDLTGFENRWWIAALWGVMKTEWDTYYQQDPKSDQCMLKATEKALAYKNIWWELVFFTDVGTTPWPVGGIDTKAAHWLMTVLLRRNIVVSRYGAQNTSRPLEIEDAHMLNGHGPALWVGNPDGVKEDENNFEDYAAHFIYDVRDDDDHSLELRKLFGRLELGGLLVPDESQQPFFFHLHNLEEAWDDTWYNKENLPTMKDML